MNQQGRSVIGRDGPEPALLVAVLIDKTFSRKQRFRSFTRLLGRHVSQLKTLSSRRHMMLRASPGSVTRCIGSTAAESRFSNLRHRSRDAVFLLASST